MTNKSLWLCVLKFEVKNGGYNCYETVNIPKV